LTGRDSGHRLAGVKESSLQLITTFEGRLREVEANLSARIVGAESRLDRHARAILQLRNESGSSERKIRKLFADVSTLRATDGKQLDLYEAL
jgi:hypothetical protein